MLQMCSHKFYIFHFSNFIFKLPWLKDLDQYISMLCVYYSAVPVFQKQQKTKREVHTDTETSISKIKFYKLHAITIPLKVIYAL